ncbi:MAG: hypothetical protein QT03_C0001G0115 [archaeon GW2011_AR10]|uniref:DMT family transporter n=1 Tax=Candidatus Iainarchaeum sp. TaxID=3101447 RepID=A0A7J4ISG3_9ARCH|nr:MAG: hypothetical protein QT03_C0001G0115 [archaeon GW2011_AR10]HIH08448.1 DMT family transporter [Candidatus Diapherotrites archaeon]
MENSKGIMLLLATAFVSGFSVFLNTFAVKGFDPFVFTTAKNVVVAVLLFSAVLLLREFRELKLLSQKQWLQLLAIGAIGGSFAFLIYFYALKEIAAAANAGFIHKTLFIWATLLAVVFLKEKINKKFLAGAALLMLGNFFLFSSISSFGLTEILLLAATMMWAAENVLAKHVLKNTSGRIVAFGRMFFGSLIMLGFLAATNQVQGMFELSVEQIQWVLLTAALLFLYVITYYAGLKYLKVSTATSMLLLSQPITGILSLVFLGEGLSFSHALGLFLIVAGTLVIFGFSVLAQLVKWKGLLLAAKRT